MSDLPVEAERSKVALRKDLLTRRREMTDSDLATAAAGLQDQTLPAVRRLAPSTVAAYVPVGPEPGSLSMLTALSRLVPRLLVPVLLPSFDLDWAVFSADLAPGRFRLLEPAGPRLGVSAIAEAGLILVPALAVDRSGQRLGRGGGSYDRALARARGTVLALLHEGELVGRVPAEPHDVPVHGVITPTAVTVLSSPAEWTK